MECGVAFVAGTVLLRESTRDGGSVKVGVDTVGVDTISPHSSSSSTVLLSKSLVGVVLFSNLSSAGFGLARLDFVLAIGGEIKLVTAGVSPAIVEVRACFGRDGPCDTSNDAARAPDAWI